MNKSRRKELKKWLENIGTIKSELENIVDDEQNYYDQIPENLQSGQRACDSEEAIDKMNEAVDILDEAINCIEEII